MPAFRARSPIAIVQMLVWTPTKSCRFEAAVGRFGSVVSSPPLRKSLHPATPTEPARAAAIAAVRSILTLWSPSVGRSAVQREREHERPRLRVVEEVEPLRQVLGAAEVRL